MTGQAQGDRVVTRTLDLSYFANYNSGGVAERDGGSSPQLRNPRPGHVHIPQG